MRDCHQTINFIFERLATPRLSCDMDWTTSRGTPYLIAERWKINGAGEGIRGRRWRQGGWEMKGRQCFI
jgi:hypothetical protein